MNPHIEEDRLQDFREGLLSPGEEEEVRAHLDRCPRCREEMESLAGLLDGLGALPREARPSRDLWPQIAWRIGASEASGKTEAESPAGRPRASSLVGRRISVHGWQLLAASITVALLSGGGVWVYLSRGAAPSGPVAQAPAGLAQPVAWDDAFRGYSDAASDLETVLEQGKDVLDPETVKVLEESLAAIDQAIAESREALDRDPGSVVLRRWLTDNLRRKVDLLRHAATLAFANT